MSVKMKEIQKYLLELFPTRLAEDYDNIGLLIGDEDKEVKNILVTLDVTSKVVDEAISNKVDLIISHHPLIFKPIKRINNKNGVEKAIYKLIKNDINLFALHTNYDNASNGMNDVIARKLGFVNIEELSNTKSETVYKFIVYVPQTHAQTVRDAIFSKGAGKIGNYDMCSFNISGEGTFRPLEGTNAFIGEIGKLEKVSEIKIETVVLSSNLSSVIQAMYDAHPYEEPAFDIIKLENKISYGTGRIGYLDGEMILDRVVDKVKQIFNLEKVIVVGNRDKKINKVAVVGGAGSDFIPLAKSKGCDLIITGDVKHHFAVDAIESDIAIIDATHYGLEQVFIEDIKNVIEDKFEGINVVTCYSIQPFTFI